MFPDLTQTFQKISNIHSWNHLKRLQEGISLCMQMSCYQIDCTHHLIVQFQLSPKVSKHMIDSLQD